MAKAKQSPESERTKQGERGERRQSLARREAYPLSLWGGSPFTLMNRFLDEMGSMFEDFGIGRGWLAPGFRRGLGRGSGEIERAMWSPQIEVFERGDQLVVRADLPGMSKEDVKVEITGGALTIQGERRQEHEEKREGLYCSERSYGSFFRSIPLPDEVNAEEAKANFSDGVLEIKMPAPQWQERRRTIEIQ